MADCPKHHCLYSRESRTPNYTIFGGPISSSGQLHKPLWHGFCEIESEPALFNVMLRDWGVKGVKVQEVVSLDNDMLQFLQPIYGLVFLFRWREDDPVKQEQSCPEGLWFANQTVNYACASVALLNIINNIEGVELDEELRSFKEFTMDFTPALRGDAIRNFAFIKEIHNSFARKMDILNVDLQLKNDASKKRSKLCRKDQGFDESEAGFHFIAFVPARGKVWKFDGLERQPQNLGDYSDEDWLELAKPEIQSRMAEYEEGQIEFSILSLAKDPMIGLVDQLAMNVKRLVFIDELLCNLPDIQGFGSLDNAIVTGPDPSFNLTSSTLEKAVVSEIDMQSYTNMSKERLLEAQKTLIDAQKEICVAIKEEQQVREADNTYAEKKRHDYGPAVYSWLRALARKGLIEHLARDTPPP
ncbi:ubiquitin carboxyl-terminal hydrolase, family 1 protein [Coccidioides immitis RS]|uniref:ubiquitinyl hydrolase 1 n=2 Tax=Coccidioides TaxID=5500 RepID=A0A0E1S0N9_COCIM|nr:ubiquitin carboxyl-terminal hydrolase, family 1 protein [Coccidioides immitis RS]XP_003070711.1 hypothetical protein CPC735_038300 [Coccidioides posadasii C735 delta SOWgp]EAS36783.2 ubiquitin carboxyl-terminal hydrolase, family 1 protein [Coccidioides immitis RS]EER28566.1 hypothetical protein CPC735_038300 [Coccidioides posadasii C735 delta SOWgp]TPX25140.1 hypothetical protein DIZ76_010589 [Coccidioides immitis]|eukprot:XP_003070711.1 hypothetical protein CPC735_038300 [Coccidioides posadasii C735 delta SOWgp]